jgi:hypothetical protein
LAWDGHERLGARVNEVLLDAFRHNNWATKSLIGFCRKQGFTPEQLEVTGVGTFGGILATPEHIIGADRSYLSHPPAPRSTKPRSARCGSEVFVLLEQGFRGPEAPSVGQEFTEFVRLDLG